MKSSIICVGVTLVDEIYFSQSPIVIETSNPAKGTMRFGGVMANVARHLAALKIPNTLITALGDDAYGNEIYHHFKASVSPYDRTLEN
jgi:pseudouridine kinase